MTKIKINGESNEVETAPITLLCHDGTSKIEIDDPKVLVIGPEQTVKVADALSQDSWDAIRIMSPMVEYWKMIFGTEPPLTLKGEGLGYRHVAGMILMLAVAKSDNLQPFVQLPESYLHPKAQCGLADFFIYAQKGFNNGPV